MEKNPSHLSENTQEYHPDIEKMKELLQNEGPFTIMAPDGFVRSGLQVLSIDRINEQGVDRWEVTLYNPEDPESEQDSIRMSLGEFEKARLTETKDAS
jgi:hypothetical protein